MPPAGTALARMQGRKGARRSRRWHTEETAVYRWHVVVWWGHWHVPGWERQAWRCLETVCRCRLHWRPWIVHWGSVQEGVLGPKALGVGVQAILLLQLEAFQLVLDVLPLHVEQAALPSTSRDKLLPESPARESETGSMTTPKYFMTMPSLKKKQCLWIIFFLSFFIRPIFLIEPRT